MLGGGVAEGSFAGAAGESLMLPIRFPSIGRCLVLVMIFILIDTKGDDCNNEWRTMVYLFNNERYIRLHSILVIREYPAHLFGFCIISSGD